MTTASNSNSGNAWIFPEFTPSASGIAPASLEGAPAADELYFGAMAETQSHQPLEVSSKDLASAPQPQLRATRLPSKSVWGTEFARATMQDAVELADKIVQYRTPEYMITANLNYLMLVEENPDLVEVNNQCCCILADGNPIVWRSRLDEDPLPCRVAGSDLIVKLARLSAEKDYRIFFLGGAPGVAKAAAAQLQQWYPHMQIAGCYSPPFRQLSPEEHEQMLKHVQDAKTDILLVAFGQPKGELWIYNNLQQLGVPLSIQLGASFDFLAGTAKRAPAFWQKIGCEWLYRAFCDPKRLFPRYGRNILFLLGLVQLDAVPVAKRLWNVQIKARMRKLLRRS
jgi:N-acetylglucosaminyldiphosphoundecaprenol N-acetyl-beta-D-mannosaminyltransferase